VAPVAPFFPMKVSLLQIASWFAPLLLAGPVLAAAPDPVETVEKAAADWVKVRAEVTRIETEWSTQQRLLDSSLSGFGERATALEAKRDFLLSKTAADREEIAGLEVADKASAAGLQATEAQLQTMSARLLGLRASLPPRLSAALDLPYKSLAGSGLTVGERMQLVMTVLNRCTQFNRAITCEEELLTVTGGATPQLLEVVYWGLSHGYALDRTAGKAWFGSPGPQGWQWEPLPDGAAAVARLVTIYRGKAEPAFVEVRGRLKNLSAGTSRN